MYWAIVSNYHEFIYFIFRINILRKANIFKKVYEAIRVVSILITKNSMHPIFRDSNHEGHSKILELVFINPFQPLGPHLYAEFNRKLIVNLSISNSLYPFSLNLSWKIADSLNSIILSGRMLFCFKNLILL